jgi:hypothetical protein
MCWVLLAVHASADVIRSGQYKVRVFGILDAPPSAIELLAAAGFDDETSDELSVRGVI